MLPNFSPKKGKKYIGNKGLGFRSIVNWSKQITIYSQNLKIDFSYEISKKILYEKSDNKIDIPKIAFLSFPNIQEHSNVDWITSIEIHYKNEYFEDIKKQLLNIKDEILLFVNNINELIIDFDGKKTKIERIKEDDHIYLNDTLWKIFEYDKNKTLLPEKYWENSEKEYFQLKIAIKENFDNKDNLLYSFFPTEISIDFPFIIHGTFELDSSRNNINISDKNSYILERLVEFIVDAAKELTRDNVSYKALEFLTHNNSNYRLSSLNFYRNIDSSIDDLEIFPCLDNKYRKKSDVVFISNEFSNFIQTTKNFDFFPNMLKPTYNSNSNLTNYYIENSVDNNVIDELSRNINNIDDRVELIYLVSQYFDNCIFELLIDEKDNKIIRKDEEVYTPITKDYDFDIPSFVKIKFINNELYTNLLKKLKISSNEKSRDLQRELKNIVNIQTYEPAQVLQKIITSTNKDLYTSNNKIEIVKEMVLSLYKNYKVLDEKTKIPENTKIQLLSRSNTIENVKDLFLSKTYPSGILAEDLFEDIFEENQFLVDNSIFNFGKNEDIELIERFFLWLGINEISKLVPTSDYKRMRYCSSYFNFISGKPDYAHHMTLERAYEIYNLDKIIEKISLEKFIIWCIKDEHIQSSFNTKELVTLRGSRGGYINQRYSTISFLYHTILSSDLLKDYLITNESLSPLINKKEISFEHDLFKKYKIKKADIESLILKIGAVDKIEDISIFRIRDILKNLEHKSPDGKQTQTIYKAIRNHKYSLNDTSIKLCAKKNGELNYYEQDKVYYVNTTKLPKKIIDNIPIINVPPRLGKVIEFFGIKDVKNIEISILEHQENTNLTKQFNDFFEQIKPFILVYRFDSLKDIQTKESELNKLKKSKIILCNKVVYKIDDEEYTLENNDYVKADEQYFIKIKNRLFDDMRKTLDFRDTFADIIGSIFNISNIEKFERLISDELKETEEIIKRNLGFEAIHESREYLNIADEFSTFWRTVYKLKDKLYQNKSIGVIVEDLDISVNITDLDYKNITSNNSCNIIKSLFAELDITIDKFNSLTTYYKLDFKKFHQENLENCFYTNFNDFEKILYKWCIDNSKEKEFIDLIGKYENKNKSNVENQLVMDYECIVNDFIKEEYEFTLKDMKTDIDFKKIHKQNESKLDSEIILSNQEKSLLYFQKGFEDLKKILKTNENEQLTNEIPNNYDDTIPANVSKASFSTPLQPKVSRNENTSYRNYNPKTDKEKKQIGNKAEQCVYNWLVKKYGQSKVKWLAKESDTGHYDIRYEKKPNKWVYVEVKAYSNDMFYLSKDEKNFAEENKGKYEIFFVEMSNDKKCENAKIYFEENIDFSDTSIFILVPNKYEVYYKIKYNKT